MIGQTSGNLTATRRAGRLAGVLVLLLAVLALAIGGMPPAYASDLPPTWPHVFVGTVSTITPPGPVPEGTPLEVYVGGVLKAGTEVEEDGKYVVETPGQSGQDVRFRVAGVLANESTKWRAGEISSPFDLTIPAMPGDPLYEVTMAENPAGAGTATDISANPPYGAGVEVDIKAVASEGYAFVNWTAQPEVVFVDATKAETSFTMPESNVTITANFDDAYTVTMQVNPAGGGTVLGEGDYAAGVQVSIKAEPATRYEFVNWTASPAVGFNNTTEAETTFTMPDSNVTVTANFERTEGAEFVLTMKAEPLVGGTLSPPVGTHPIEEGQTVNIVATAASGAGYRFLYWMSSTPVNWGNQNSPATSFTMPSNDVEITAVFSQDAAPPVGGCFIATAAYGTPSAPKIDVLREFRDSVLLENALGSRFVDIYYRFSPPVADVISGSNFLRTVVRELLVAPAVWLVEATGDIWRR